MTKNVLIAMIAVVVLLMVFALGRITVSGVPSQWDCKVYSGTGGIVCEHRNVEPLPVVLVWP